MNLFPCPHCGSSRYVTLRGKPWPGAKMGPFTGSFRCDDCGDIYTRAESMAHETLVARMQRALERSLR